MIQHALAGAHKERPLPTAVAQVDLEIDIQPALNSDNHALNYRRIIQQELGSARGKTKSMGTSEWTGYTRHESGHSRFR